MIDAISRKEDGLEFLYDHIEALDRVQIFKDTAWEDPQKLVPQFVKGTLLASSPYNILELVSELKMLKIARGEYETDQISQEEAGAFLEDMLVATFDLAYRDTTEAERIQWTEGEQKRIRQLFDFILARYTFPALREKLELELRTMAAQRPILTHRIEALIRQIHQHIELDPTTEHDRQLQFFVDALFFPTPLARRFPKAKDYLEAVEEMDATELEEECGQMGTKMHQTGLVSSHLLTLLKYLSKREDQLIPTLLQLSTHGAVDFKRHRELVSQLIQECLLHTNKQAVYGLKRMLERNLLSRRPVRNALQRLRRVSLHDDIATHLKKSSLHHHNVSPLKLLIGGAISVLGQPLGIGQGNNPTCQSARGISMWSLQAPAKLLNMIIEVAVTNYFEMRYEGELIVSDKTEARTDEFYLNMDPVSVVMVPHLDHIYQQMMQKAQLKHIGVDPHASVNPAFYGHWIQTGFLSCYNPLTAAIDNFPAFVKTFYAAFHPLYNGGHQLVYSVPIGIFITSSRGELLGFHAISLLRIAKNQEGEWRAYFFNPNNEGRQNWGQGIRPTVYSHSEKAGESSLPFHEFVARVYAFHYNARLVAEKIEDIPQEVVHQVQTLARESWGKKYIWI